MSTRRSFILFLLVVHGEAYALGKKVTTEFQSIGVGPFEFPVSGIFVVTQEGGATVLTTPDETRWFRVASFNNIAAHRSADVVEQLSKVESVLRRSWEQFATDEQAKVVEPFSRTDLSSHLALFSMASEFNVNGETTYYVQFAVGNGPRIGSLFAEGYGSAQAAFAELEPLARKVKVAGGA